MSTVFEVEAFLRRTNDRRSESLVGPWSWEDEARTLEEASEAYEHHLRGLRYLPEYVSAIRLIEREEYQMQPLRVIRQNIRLAPIEPPLRVHPVTSAMPNPTASNSVWMEPLAHWEWALLNPGMIRIGGVA